MKTQKIPYFSKLQTLWNQILIVSHQYTPCYKSKLDKYTAQYDVVKDYPSQQFQFLVLVKLILSLCFTSLECANDSLVPGSPPCTIILVRMYRNLLNHRRERAWYAATNMLSFQFSIKFCLGNRVVDLIFGQWGFLIISYMPCGRGWIRCINRINVHNLCIQAVQFSKTFLERK